MVFNVFLSSDDYAFIIDMDKMKLDEILICLDEQHGSQSIVKTKEEALS